MYVQKDLKFDFLYRFRDSLWKYTDNSLEIIKQKLNHLGFNEMEQKHLEDIHNFIERHSLGVSISNLMVNYLALSTREISTLRLFTHFQAEFPYENFLFKALNILSSEYLIKRVGISCFMYVHKNHIRSWVVHTFNLKRLDRENIGGSTSAIKRSFNQEESISSEESCEIKSKRCKTISGDGHSEERNKRTPKPVRRFDATQLEKENSSTNLKER